MKTSEIMRTLAQKCRDQTKKQRRETIEDEQTREDTTREKEDEQTREDTITEKETSEDRGR